MLVKDLHLSAFIGYDYRNYIVFYPLPPKKGKEKTEAIPTVKLKPGDCPHKTLVHALKHKRICQQSFVLEKDFIELSFFDIKTNTNFIMYVFVQKIGKADLHPGTTKYFESPDDLIDHWHKHNDAYLTDRSCQITKMNLAALAYGWPQICKKMVA